MNTVLITEIEQRVARLSPDERLWRIEHLAHITHCVKAALLMLMTFGAKGLLNHETRRS